MNTSIKRISLATALLSAMVILGAGCGGRADEPTASNGTTEATSTVLGTLTFTTRDPEKGLLSGTFEYDGYTIRFDVARGPEMEKLYQSEGNPIHSIDARVCDEKYFCFSQQAGGHAFADPNWVPDNSEANAPDDDRALKNNQTTWKLRQHLLILGKDDFEGLGEEYQTLLNVSNIPPEEWGLPIMELQKQKQLNLGTPQKGVLAYVNGTTGPYTVRFEIAWQYVVFAYLQVGEHTSTLTRVYDSNGGVRNRFVSCNHGACADWSNMSIFCRRDFSNRGIELPFNNKCDVPSTNGTTHPSGASICCNTPYNWTGASNTHVCNDDSERQLQAMVYNTKLLFTPYCGDSVLARFAPACN